MKAVAERDHHPWIVARDDRGEQRQRRCRIPGRQQDATRGKTRSLLKVQVGDDQQPLVVPVQCTGGVGGKRHASDLERCRSKAHVAAGDPGVHCESFPYRSIALVARDAPTEKRLAQSC
jgi:hypothetical protein